MKKLIAAVLVLMTAVLIAAYFTRPKSVSSSAPGADPKTIAHPLSAPPAETLEPSPSVSASPSIAPIAPAPASLSRGPSIQQAIDTLVSPHATFDQKQAAWNQFGDTNLLNQAIAHLELRIQANPALPEPHAALGMAYLRKCDLIEDVREMGILAMQADQSFDTALELDPWNWDARFTKAVAMSFWPPELNKTAEVLAQFRLLIEQQEAQPSQPHFALTYLKLAGQYEKAGHADDARQVYERGAALFPGNEELQAKLNAQ